MSYKRPIPFIFQVVLWFTWISLVFGILGLFGKHDPWIVLGINIVAISYVWDVLWILLYLYVIQAINNPTKTGGQVVVAIYVVTAIATVIQAIFYMLFPDEALTSGSFAGIIIFLLIKCWIAYAVYADRHYFDH